MPFLFEKMKVLTNYPGIDHAGLFNYPFANGETPPDTSPGTLLLPAHDEVQPTCEEPEKVTNIAQLVLQFLPCAVHITILASEQKLWLLMHLYMPLSKRICWS